MVKVSVIIPVYNVQKYIAKCLDSLVNQTLKDIEIIVVNDGSPDNSQKIVDKYVKKYPQMIKSYIKENGGQGSARNFGIKKAHGEYIGYVDSDDYVREDMFEKLYNKAKEDNLDIAICGNYIVDEDYKVINTELNNYVINDNKENAFFGKLAVWNKIYKKELVDNLEFRSKVWYEDLDFTVNVLTKAKRVGYVDLPLYYYLLREGSTMNNSNVIRNLEIFEAFDQIKNNKKYYDFIEYLAIDNILISAIVRVINAKAHSKLKKETINKMYTYVLTNFKSYKNNKYLSLLPRNRKIVYNLVNLKLYFLIRLIFKIKGK